MTYPKIETLFVRDPDTHKVTVGELRKPEFGLVKNWIITEKIDGTNVRVFFSPGDTHVAFGGRTDNAQMPTFLLDHLQRTFTVEKMAEVFDNGVDAVILYGEGYGPKIQKGGGNYRDDVSFRLFDVRVTTHSERGEGNWWLEWSDVEDVATKLGIKTVPMIGTMTDFELIRPYTTPSYVIGPSRVAVCVIGPSRVAVEEARSDLVPREGIVARTEPALYDKYGKRIMWKLKEQDFS